jgi:ribose transport system permease protein
MSASDIYARLRYRLIPDHLVGELLTRPWVDNFVPAGFLILSLAVFGAILPGFFSIDSFLNMGGQLGEVSLITIGMTIVILSGGIDLSVGSTFALSNFLTLFLVNFLGWHPLLALPVVLLASSLVGLLNGLLIGYLRLRAFLTTLATLIIVRAIVDELVLNYARTISSRMNMSDLWFWFGDGKIVGIPVAYFVAVIIAIAMHILLSRMRLGWHILAIGGSRRSAFNAGIRVRFVVCASYVMSSTLTGLASFFYAARLNSAGSDTGVGIEVTVLTAAVLGGISLGGGRGSIFKAMLGAIIVLLITNSLIRLDMPSGTTPLVLGVILLLGVAVDIRWNKNRHKLLSRVYVSPTYLQLPDCPDTSASAKSPYAINDRLRGVGAIGLGQIEGPEDVIFDSQDNLYSGSRHGDLLRFKAPDYEKPEVFAHLGGFPLGLAMDRDDNIYTCVGGMGLYRVGQDGSVDKLSDQTPRSLFSVNDDSRIRMADDLDIAPDGRVFFSEATTRYDIHDWVVDAIESRPNGRVLCYDPKTGKTETILRKLVFPNGICMAGDGQSFLFAETWACRISRHWFAGPRSGQTETVIHDLPGYPDNINLASDGTIWCALAGMRSPVFDLSLKMPGFRRRMVREVASDGWIFPNVNTGCVLRFDLSGKVLESLWDLGGQSHPQITSMREHKGFLYLGGISNNRIGSIRLQNADPSWTSQKAYWGKTS